MAKMSAREAARDGSLRVSRLRNKHDEERMDTKDLDRPPDRVALNEHARTYSGDRMFHRLAAHTRQPGALLDHAKVSVDVNERDDEGRTPLHVACEFNSNRAVVEALIGLGADVSAEDRSGMTPLDCAAEFNDCAAVVSALHEAGADVCRRRADSTTPLHWAAWHNRNPAVIATILDAGADVNARACDGSTPLHAAALTCSADSVGPLIAGGADVNAVDRHGRTPLHEAALFSPPAVMAMLLEAGADGSRLDSDGRTPWAIAQGNPNLKASEPAMDGARSAGPDA